MNNKDFVSEPEISCFPPEFMSLCVAGYLGSSQLGKVSDTAHSGIKHRQKKQNLRKYRVSGFLDETL